ncbi:putative kinesin [Trypanosoma rangeli]|uniref:Kinesin-like protein n=1 Tax=Trypanosoma rangeli TaxID=5698 RepID=A0A3R7LER1_TRYRA|nr:putative kinesin [Trypanosoma rangeli]RNE95845.1 putative kinesin [Trypanosoma rangeli]|eukprot:RNE95845.1 putative kinesin [Trypanosoma rangeli]
MWRQSASMISARGNRQSKPPLMEDDESVAGPFSPRNERNPSKKKNEVGITVTVRIRPFLQQEKVGETDGKGRMLNGLDEPVVDVDADGKTLLLRDPQSSGGSSLTFVFDTIFSSLAPTVDLGASGTRNHEGTGSNRQKGSPRHVVNGAGGTLELRVTPDDAGNYAVEQRCSTNAREEEQKQVYKMLAIPVVDWSLRGFNACIIAYGQTGSGKTYTMMGTPNCEGLIPRLCRLLFTRIAETKMVEQQLLPSLLPSAKNSPECSLSEHSSRAKSEVGDRYAQTLDASMSCLNYPVDARLAKVTISFMEIYNEQVRDLLKPERRKGNISQFSSRFHSDPMDAYETLRVRQHPLYGRFVEGLTTIEVDDWSKCLMYIKQGNAVRAQASTKHNENSSRSHAIFQIALTQTVHLGGRVRGKEVTTHCTSRINLIDLAGSERLQNISSKKHIVAETNAINLSLSVLRRVITALANREKLVPYRESILTYVLADNFGGNSHTIMCATISPHHSKSAETESTLRYASLARGIVNSVKVNEKPHAKIIRELKERMKQLQEKLRGQHDGEQVVALEGKIKEKAYALEELRQREEELQTIVLASRQREKKLLEYLKKNQAAKDMWRQKAQKLKEERTQLIMAVKERARLFPDLAVEDIIKLANEGSETESESVPSTTSLAYASLSQECLPKIINVASNYEEALEYPISSRPSMRIGQRHQNVGSFACNASSRVSYSGVNSEASESRGKSLDSVISHSRGGDEKRFFSVTRKSLPQEEDVSFLMTPRPHPMSFSSSPNGANGVAVPCMPYSLMQDERSKEMVSKSFGRSVRNADKRKDVPLKLTPLQVPHTPEAAGAMKNKTERGTSGRSVSRKPRSEEGFQCRMRGRGSSSGETTRRLAPSKSPSLRALNPTEKKYSGSRSLLTKRH